MLLADQGAEVIKVEPAVGMGDMTRLPAYAKGGLGAFYLNNNRGKKALSVDLQSDEGRQIVLELAKDADVFIQNFRPGAVDRLGIGFDDVKAINPDIVYCSISGFGPTGPYAGQPVLDPVIQGLAGVISRQMNPQIPFPDLIRNLYADKSTALTAAQAITAALLVREREGIGQHVEVPMLDSCLYFFWPDGMMDMTLLDEDVSPGFLLSSVYNLTDASDGKFVYFVASDQMRHALFDALDHPEWKDDERFTMAGTVNPENFAALGELLTVAFEAMTVDEILERLRANDVPCGPILDADQVIVDAQVVHNGALVEWEHPIAGKVRQPKPAARFSETPAELNTSGSLKGADNDEILAGLGRTPEQIATLRESGVIT
jgi:crotonobetainyl-CoA:carnitine CoA-transferase CaiB-like acyl-CoA transferase